MLHMNPSRKGERTEGVVLATLLRLGKNVLLPFGSHLRYDLVFEEDASFRRVQCKTGRIRNGGIVFNTSSRTSGSNRGYVGEIDLFGVYCPENEGVYLVPVQDVGVTEAKLWIATPRSKRHFVVRWAADYLLS